MTREQLIAALTSTQDQDIEECLRWFRDNSQDAHTNVWMFIQHLLDQPVKGREDWLLHLVGRFAQLGFTHAMLLKEEREKVK